jgi:hypothetical protein
MRKKQEFPGIYGLSYRKSLTFWFGGISDRL